MGSKAVPLALKAIQEDIKQTTQANHEAFKAGNHALVAEHSATLDKLAQKSKNTMAVGGTNLVAYGLNNIWIQIHNENTDSVMYNKHGWTVKHGWFRSPAVGDILPGQTIKLAMGGDGVVGIDCEAYYYFDIRHPWSIWWMKSYDGIETYGVVGPGSGSYRTWRDDSEVHFYLRQDIAENPSVPFNTGGLQY